MRRFAGTTLAVLLAMTVAPVAVRAASNVVTLVGPGVTQQSKGAKVDGGALRVASRTSILVDEHVACGDSFQVSLDTGRYERIKLLLLHANGGSSAFDVYYMDGGTLVAPVITPLPSVTDRYERLIEVPGTRIQIHRFSCQVGSSDTILVFGR